MLRGLAEELTGEQGAAGRGNRKHHNPREWDREEQKVGTAKPRTRSRRTRIAARRSASRSIPRRSKGAPTSSIPSIQPPKIAESTGTTVCPTTGTNPVANSISAPSMATAISASACRSARARPRATFR